MPRRTSLVTAVVVVTATALIGGSALAEPFPETDLPPALKPWVPWVLDDVPDHACPAVDGQAICSWPGELQLVLSADGGRFAQSAVSDRRLYFPLPGDEAHWPQAVRVNGRAATVLEVDGRPVVELEAGRWRIEGSLVWSEMPEGIHVPPRTALVALEIGGTPVPFPRRDEDGLLWLQTGTEAGEEGETLDIEVYRHIADGVPLTVTTRLVLRASGKAREIDLGPVLLEGTTVMSVDAGIPARIDKDGNLRVQVRAGTHDVEITALSQSFPEKITRRVRAPVEGGEDPWPTDEIWVWQADEALRQVTLAGPPGIDPARTNLPDAWGGLPAFLVQPDGALELTVTRRGEPDPPPDRLVLQRELWMDLDGDGFTVRDNLSGELNRTWRLDLEPPGALGHVAVSGDDQLITAAPGSKKPGVELRSGALDLTAEWRIEDGAKEIPAVGWSEDVQELDATLNLPPGWSLISARGVDELPGTWWDEWDLFSFFFVLLVSLAVAKLTRWYFGLIALATLVLLHQNPDYPFGIWVFVWVSILVFLGLLKVLPNGKLHIATRICWWVTALALVLMLVPYSVDQVRTGLYPQIDEDYDTYFDPFVFADYEQEMGFPVNAPAAVAPEPQMNLEGKDRLLELELGAVGGETIEVAEEEIAADEDVTKVMKGKKKAAEMDQIAQVQIDGRGLGSLGDVLDVSSGRYDVSLKKRGPSKADLWRQALQQDPKAIVQTGPGVPNWSWQSWHLSWSGPVDREHQIKLYLFSPKINMLLSFLRVALLVLLALFVLREALAVIRKKKAESPRPKKPSGGGKRAAAAGAAVLIAALAVPATARAEEPPPQEVLDELLDKLTRPEDCLPDCVSASLLDVRAADSTLTVTAEVHVGARASWRLPGPAGNWVPDRVDVDGWPTTALALLDDGFLHVRLEPGVHRVVATGPIPPTDAVTLEFGEPPHRVTVDAPGFSLDGLREDGRAEESIQLTRLAQVGGVAGDVAVDESSYPPWLEITRTLDLGIPWLVHTTVRRVSPVGSPVMARVPLLPGESVTESELQVEDGEVVLSLGRDDTIVQWSSTLETQPKLSLVSPEGKPWSEIWVLSPSPIWTVDHEGLPPVHHKVDGNLRPTFRPWPGESLNLELTRPKGVEGQSVTVDSAHLQVSPGIRLVEASLALSVRSSRGGAQQITLPDKASIQQLTVDGAEQPFRQDGRKVEVTLRPGTQRIEIDWQQPGGITSKYRVPEVGIGGSAANATVTVLLPNDRWLLFVSFGQRWGPAVLFWGFLLTILIAAGILGRVKLSPLKWWQWALLALGLTQIPVPVSVIIVGWFFILSWRKSKPPAHFFLHNSLQIVIGLWTLVALICLVVAVYTGLAVQPDMQVAGGGSTNTELNWYVDRVDGTMPTPWVLSLPLLSWKIIMLVWSLWLAWSLVRWARWGWKAFSHELLWRSIPQRPVPPPRQPVPRGGSKPPEAPPDHEPPAEDPAGEEEPDGADES